MRCLQCSKQSKVICTAQYSGGKVKGNRKIIKALVATGVTCIVRRRKCSDNHSFSTIEIYLKNYDYSRPIL